MTITDITAIDLRDYAKSLGWILVKEALQDGLYVLNSPYQDYKQLIFPKEFTDSTNEEQIRIVLDRLSSVTGKSTFRIIQEVKEVNDDVLSLRYFSENKVIDSLSFEGALEAIEGTKQLILSAATSVIHPATYHPRLSRTEPNELLKKTRFRHTQEGSFILKVSCPIEIQRPRPSLFGEDYETPFARQTFKLINEASNSLLNAIESDSEEQYISDMITSETPLLSYNFCDAIIDLYDEERELPFELGFSWSRNAHNMIPEPQTSPVLRFPYSLKSKIEAVRSYLKPVDESLEGQFIATVESLSGNIDEQGNRFGEVRLSVLKGSTITLAKAELDSYNYVIADQAHMRPGSYVRFKGKLQPGKKLRLITDITDFNLL